MGRLRNIQGYYVLATIGAGAKSTIYSVRDRGKQVYALKHVKKDGPKDQRFIDQAVLEYNVSSKLKHPNLRQSIKLIRQRQLLRTTEVFVIMEMIDGHTLEQYQPSDYVQFCKLCQQVTLGLNAMHQAGFVHGDIKPNNILITDKDQIKIIDLGQSCTIGTIKKRIQGTPDYIAPEQVKRQKITPLTDIFNLGATMYWLLTGRYVPTLIPKRRNNGASSDSLLKVTVQVKGTGGTGGGRKRVAYPSPSQLNDQVPSALSTLVMDCVRYKPAQRPVSMEIVYERLELAITQIERSDGTASIAADRRSV